MEKQHVSRGIRQKYLEKYRQAVAYYQPLIEGKISQLGREVALGEVRVRDMKYLGKDNTGHILRKAMSEATPFEKLLLPAVFQAMRFFPGGFESRGRERQLSDITAYSNQTIYVSFLRAPLDVLESRIELATVHELSYCLWENLNGEKLQDIEKDNPDSGYFLQVFPSFAFYCSRRLFFDLYPQKVQEEIALELRVCPNNPYTKSRKRVEKLVALHGEKVLLEIPSRWRELSKSV